MLEILKLLLEPNGIETQQAIAPLIVAAAVAAPAVANAISSYRQSRQYADLRDETSDKLNELEDPEFGVSGSLKQLATQAYDPTVLDRQLNQLSSATGTAMNVLSKGTGGNVADVLRAQNSAMLNIGATAADKTFQARTNLGSAEQSAMQRKDTYLINRENTLEGRELSLEMARMDAQKQMIDSVGQAIGDGFGGYMAGQNFNNAAKMRDTQAAMYGLGQPNLSEVQKQAYQNIINQNLGLPQISASAPQAPKVSPSGAAMMNPFVGNSSPFGLDLSPFQTQLPPVNLNQGSGFLGFQNAMIPNVNYDTYNKYNPFMGEHGAIVKSPSVGLLERMHGVKMSPGKFSHKENPIDIVQQGMKIGEMTGGEGIMPPDMMIEIKAHISNGDADSLLNLMSDILSKWESEADIEQKAKEKKNAN